MRQSQRFEIKEKGGGLNCESVFGKEGWEDGRKNWVEKLKGVESCRSGDEAATAAVAVAAVGVDVGVVGVVGVAAIGVE